MLNLHQVSIETYLKMYDDSTIKSSNEVRNCVNAVLRCIDSVIRMVFAFERQALVGIPRNEKKPWNTDCEYNYWKIVEYRLVDHEELNEGFYCHLCMVYVRHNQQ